jgi:hypothetical protein
MAKAGDSKLHPSVVELLKEGGPGETAADIIVRKARAIIEKAMSFGWAKDAPPFDPDLLADIEGIIVRPAPCDIRSHGRIFPKGDKVYIEYDPNQTEERRRFTICHEIAHTLFPDCYKRERRRTPSKEDKQVEDLCNLAASEILFPSRYFESDIAGKEITGEGILALAARYQASIDATSRKLVNSVDYPACVLFAKYKEPQGKGRTSLVMQYPAPNAHFKIWFPRNYRINSNSIANESHRDRKIFRSDNESWCVAGKWCEWSVEAIPLPPIPNVEVADLAILLMPSR